jgi:hypothetical protein
LPKRKKELTILNREFNLYETNYNFWIVKESMR